MKAPTKLKVLCITQSPPATSAMPGPQRFYNLCKELAKNNSLDLFVIDKNAQPDFNQSAYGDTFSSIHFNTATDNNAQCMLSRCTSYVLKQVHRLLIQAYYKKQFTRHEYFQETKKNIARYVQSYDVLFIDGLTPTQYLARDTAQVVVVDFCDSISSLYRGHAAHADSFLEKCKLLVEAFAIQKEERRAIALSDYALAVSDKDRQALEQCSHGTPIETIGLGIDLEYFHATHSSKKIPRTCVLWES